MNEGDSSGPETDKSQGQDHLGHHTAVDTHEEGQFGVLLHVSWSREVIIEVQACVSSLGSRSAMRLP